MTDLAKQKRERILSLYEAKVTPPPLIYEPSDTEIIKITENDISSRFIESSSVSQNIHPQEITAEPLNVAKSVEVPRVLLIESDLPSRISRPSAFNVRETIEKRHQQILRLKKRAARKKLRKLRRALIAADDDLDELLSVGSVNSLSEASISESSSKLSEDSCPSSDQYFSLNSEENSPYRFQNTSESSSDETSSLQSSRLVLKALESSLHHSNFQAPRPKPRKRRLGRALCKQSPALLSSEVVSSDQFSDCNSILSNFNDKQSSIHSASTGKKRPLNDISSTYDKPRFEKNIEFNNCHQQKLSKSPCSQSSDSTSSRYFSELSPYASDSLGTESPIPPPRRRHRNKRRADRLTVDKENKSAWLRQAKQRRSLGVDAASEDFSDNASTYSEPQWVGKARKKLECMNVYLSSTTDAVSISSQLTEASSTWSRGGLDALEELREEVTKISEAIEEEATAKVDTELGLIGVSRGLPIMDKERSPERLRVTFDRPETPENTSNRERGSSPKSHTRFGDLPLTSSSPNIPRSKRNGDISSSRNEPMRDSGFHKREVKKTPSPPTKRKKDNPLPAMRFGDTPQDILTNHEARSDPKSSSKFESISGPDPSTMTLGELNQNVEEYDFPLPNPGKPHWELLKFLEINSKEEENIPEIISKDNTGPRPKSILKRSSMGETATVPMSFKDTADPKYSPVHSRPYSSDSLDSDANRKISELLRESEYSRSKDSSPIFPRKHQSRDSTLSSSYRDESSPISVNKMQNLHEKFSNSWVAFKAPRLSEYKHSPSPEAPRRLVTDSFRSSSKEPISTRTTHYSNRGDNLALQDWEEKERERMDFENSSKNNRKSREIPTSIQELVQFHSGLTGRIQKNNRSDRFNGFEDSKENIQLDKRPLSHLWNRFERNPSPDAVKPYISSPISARKGPSSKPFTLFRSRNLEDTKPEETHSVPNSFSGIQKDIEIGTKRRHRSPEYYFGTKFDDDNAQNKPHLTYPMKGKRLTTTELSSLAADKNNTYSNRKPKPDSIDIRKFDYESDKNYSRYDPSSYKRSPSPTRKSKLFENTGSFGNNITSSTSKSFHIRDSPERQKSPESSRFNARSILDSIKSKSTRDSKETTKNSPLGRLTSLGSTKESMRKRTDFSRSSSRSPSREYVSRSTLKINDSYNGFPKPTSGVSPRSSYVKSRSPSPIIESVKKRQEIEKPERFTREKERLTSLSSIIGTSSRSPSVSTTGHSDVMKYKPQNKEPTKEIDARKRTTPTKNIFTQDSHKTDRDIKGRVPANRAKKSDNTNDIKYDRAKRRTPERAPTPKRSMRDELLNKELVRKKSSKDSLGHSKTGSTAKPSTNSHKSSLRRNNSRKTESGGESENYESVRFKAGEGWNSTSIRRKRLSSISSDQRSLARSDSGKSKEGRRFVSEASKGLEKWAKDIKVPGKLVKKEGHKYSHSVEEEEKNGHKTSKAVSRKVVRRGSRKMSKGGEIVSATTKINLGDPGTKGFTSLGASHKGEKSAGAVAKTTKSEDLSRKLKTSTDGERYMTTSLRTADGVDTHTTEGVDQKTTKSVELIGDAEWEGKREVSGKYGERVVVERSGGTGVRPSTVVKKLASQSKIISTKTKKKR